MNSFNLSVCRSLIFIPGLEPEQFDKAREVGADGLIVDLEDTVAISKKAEARSLALPYFVSPTDDGFIRGLRINSPRTLDGLRDLTATLDTKVKPDVLFIPKCESAAELCMLDELFSGEIASSIIFVPIIESARGLSAADEIANANSRVGGILFGGADFAANIGATMDWEALLFARSRIVQAAATAGISAIDVPYLNIDDEKGLKTEIEAIKKLGFTGKSAIHLKHIATINEAFTPDSAAIEQARKIVAADKSSKGDACVVDGKFVDKPIVHAAQRTLVLAEALTNKTLKPL